MLQHICGVNRNVSRLRKHSINSVLAVFLIGAMLLVAFPGAKCLAHDRAEHDTILDSIMFGDLSRLSNSWSEKIEALHSASFIAIDQFNGNGQSDLDVLKDYGVSKIPENIGEINFTEWGERHRMYTHLGWDHYYQIDKAKWSKRKEILTNTVGKVFNFAKVWNSTTCRFEYTSKAQSVAAFIYYVHLLGDFHGDFQDKHYYGSDYVLPLASGSTQNNSVIKEIKNHLALICETQVNSRSFNGLMTELTSYDSTIFSIINNRTGQFTDDEFGSLYEATDGVISLLKQHVPNLLRNESFFNNTFPKSGDDVSSFWDWLPWNKNE